MKKLLFISLLALVACKKEGTLTDTATDSTAVDTTLIAPPEGDSAINDKTETVAPERTTANPDESVTGNFTGKETTAMATLIRKGEGNPVENGSAAVYSLTFSDPNIPALPAGCCAITLINEGDLNGDGLDELGYAQAPMNGCVFDYYVYTFKGGKWNRLIESFQIPTGCEGVARTGLQKKVFKEGNDIYYMKTDVNNENMKEIKIKAKVLVK